MIMALRWGIVGAGSIAEKFIDALNTNLTTVEHKVVAICSHDEERAKSFATKFKIQRFYADYKSLAQDDMVEIAYIAVLNPQHYEVCLLMLRYGKHILCETPFCMNEWQTDKVLQYARHHELFAIAGIWSRFVHPNSLQSWSDPSYKFISTFPVNLELVSANSNSLLIQGLSFRNYSYPFI